MPKRQAIERVFFLNTDAGSNGGISYHDEWIRRRVVVTSGNERYRNALARLPRGTLVLVYANGAGVVALGCVESAQIMNVARPNAISPREPVEYHLAVSWLADLRTAPLTRSEIAAICGRGPIQALEEVADERKKKALLQCALGRAVQPTADPERYQRVAAALRRQGPLPKPAGQPTPRRIEAAVVRFERDPAVRAWTLQRASGCCELCGSDAPFVDLYGEAYLESHHVQPLATGGRDTPDNTAALCPNCHREMHHGTDREAKSATLLRLIQDRERMPQA